MLYGAKPTDDLVSLLRDERGLDPASAELAVIFNADPNVQVMDLARRELHTFQFPALAYAAQTALAAGCTHLQRLSLLHALIDHGANRTDAAGILLAAYSDLWQSHPDTARRMVIGLHTLTQALEPYVAGIRAIPAKYVTVAPLPIRPPGPDEIPF